MKILQRPLWKYLVVIYVICYVLSTLLHGIIELIYFGVNSEAPLLWSFTNGIDFVVSILFFLLIWKYLDYRFLNVKPSAEFAYPYEEGPWLHWRDNPQTTIIINWYTQTPSTTELRYGLDKEKMNLVITSEDPIRMHHLTLTELQSNTTYYYQIPDFLDDKKHQFTTAPNTIQPFTCVVAGDTQNGGGEGQPNWGYPKVVEQMKEYHSQNPIDLYFHVGDFSDQGNDLKSYHAVFDVSKDLFPEIPFHATMGNHDGGSSFNKDPTTKRKLPDDGANWDYFFNYKYGPLINEDEITAFTSRYFSFYYSNCLFLMLDSVEPLMANPWNKQWEFIKQELENCPSDYWKIVFIHRYQFFVKKKTTINDPSKRYKIKYNFYAPYFVPLFDQYGIDIVFSGHGHYYANLDWKYTKESRIYKKSKQPLTKDLEPKEKLIHYITTGGGGNQLRKNSPVTPDEVKIDGFYYYENSSQFIILKVNKKEITVESRYAESGKIMHKKTYKKF